VREVLIDHDRHRHSRPVIARREAPDDVPAEWRTAPTAPTAGRALYPDLDESIPFVVVPTRDDPELAALFAWRRKVDDPVEAGLTVATAWAALNDRVGADITFTRAGTAPIRRRWLLPIDTDVAWLTAAGSAAFLLFTEADAARQCAPWPVGLPFGGYPSQALAGAVARMTLARARSRGAVNEAVTRGNVGPSGMLDDPLSGPCVAAAVRRACHASRAAAEAHALR